MKRGLLILAAAMTAGILAFFLVRGQPLPATDPILLDSLPELAWLHTDLELNDEQFAKVGELHRAYRPVCAEMCRRIAESEATVANLANTQGEMVADLARAIDNHGRVIAECKRSMLEHIYQSASLMDERQAGRYLEVTIPLALDSARDRTKTLRHE